MTDPDPSIDFRHFGAGVSSCSRRQIATVSRMKNEFVSGQDWTRSGSTITGKGEAKSEFRGLQADLNQYATAASFEGVKVDGILGPQTVDAANKVVKAVLATSSLLVPVEFETPDNVDHVARYAARIRDWLHSTAAMALKVTP